MPGAQHFFLNGLSCLNCPLERPTSLLLVLFLAFISLCSCESKPEAPPTEVVLQTQQVTVYSINDIADMPDKEVAPFLYSQISGLDTLPIELKKEKFAAALLPAILVVKHEFEGHLDRLRQLTHQKNWSHQDSLFFDQLTQDFKTQDTTQLLSALLTHPNSIVIGQAAIESGWGNSRIFKTANNLFGVWSFDPNEPRVAANVKRNGRTIFLRKYDNVSESIRDYFRTIGRSAAYRNFRQQREVTQRVDSLIPHLLHYSEMKELYVKQLGIMIRHNGLTEYDDYRLDSAYFVNVPVEAQ